MNLQSRLYIIAIQGLKEANSNNPFWSKREAFNFINGVRHDLH